MTRISSLLVASTLAILPISAFAQTTTVPAKGAEPTGMTATPPSATAPATAKMGTAKTGTAEMGTAKMGTAKTGATKTGTTTAAKPDVKTPATGAKTEMHGMNSNSASHAKTSVPAKTAEPSKS